MKNEKEVTIKEFQNWLDGVVEFQDEGWTPNAEQWEKILDKIGRLVDGGQSNMPTQHRAQQFPMQQQRPQPQHQGSSLLDPNAIQNAPQPPQPPVEDYVPTGLSPEEEYQRQQEMDALKASDAGEYVSKFS